MNRVLYSTRLLNRLLEQVVGITKGAPVPPSFWAELAHADEMLVDALNGYEQGVVDKEELDQKAVSYLNYWRELWQGMA